MGHKQCLLACAILSRSFFSLAFYIFGPSIYELIAFVSQSESFAGFSNSINFYDVWFGRLRCYYTHCDSALIAFFKSSREYLITQADKQC